MINTSGIVDGKILNIFKEAGKFMIIMALSAIGLKTVSAKLAPY